MRLKWRAGICSPDQTRTTVWKPPFTDPRPEAPETSFVYIVVIGNAKGVIAKAVLSMKGISRISKILKASRLSLKKGSFSKRPLFPTDTEWYTDWVTEVMLIIGCSRGTNWGFLYKHRIRLSLAFTVVFLSWNSSLSPHPQRSELTESDQSRKSRFSKFLGSELKKI